MAFRLPRLPKDLALVDKLGRVSVEFQRWWQTAMLAIENVLIDLTETIARVATTETDIAAIEAVTFTAGSGLTGGGGLLTNPAFAVGAGTGIVVNADDVAVSAKLALYHGGDTPSAFTLGIVDSADAAAWRAAIGAGTSSTTGTVTSVAASGGSTGFSFTGGPITGSGTLTLTGTLEVDNGGTNLTSYTAGDLIYATGATTLAKLGIGANNYVLTSNGTAPGWTANTGTGNVVRATQPQFTTTIGVGTAASASGSGISFPATQSASTDPNTLDDYEEGTWTPTVGAYVGSITSYTATGAYTKIGRQVTFTVVIDITNNGTGATGLYYDLPFNSGASGAWGGTGRETTVGTMLQVEVPPSWAYAQVVTYNNLYPAATGYRLITSATYFV